MSIEILADALIASCCGTHSLGLVYEFLLKTYGNPKQARADFMKYLSGELSPRLLKEAQFWVAEEQGWDAADLIDEYDHTATLVPADPVPFPQDPITREYEPVQG